MKREMTGPAAACVTTLFSTDVAKEAPPLEWRLPTAVTRIVVSLGAEPLRVRDEDGREHPFGHMVVSGGRDRAYLCAPARSGRSVGAELAAGGALALLGPKAGELAGRHVSLSELWGAAAEQLRERIASAITPESQLDVLEEELRRRLRGAAPVPRVVRVALEQLDGGTDIGDVVVASGYTHRGFVKLFRDTVGLAPKRYARVRRFLRAIDGLRRDVGMVDAALACGYADQSHLTRELRALAGVTPGVYLRSRPTAPHHLPLTGKISSRRRASEGAEVRVEETRT